MMRVILFVSVVITGLWAGHAFIDYLELPVVEKSFSSSKCVRVYGGDDQFNCSNLPKKYNLDWVK